MRKLFTVSVLLILFLVGCEKATTEPDNEFLGLRFGSSIMETQDAMEAVNSIYWARWFKKSTDNLGNEILYYKKNHVFDGSELTVCVITDNKLSHVSVVFTPYISNKDQVFSQLKEYIEDKYRKKWNLLM